MGSFGVTKAARIQAGPHRAAQRQSHVSNARTFPWGSCERIQTELCPLGLQLAVLFLGKAAKCILHSKLPQRCLPVLYFPGVAPLQRKPDWVWLNKSVLTDSWLKYCQTPRWTPGWHSMCSRGDKRPARCCKAECPCPLLWGTQPSVRTWRDLRQRELFSLIEWRPLCISSNQRGTRHHEPLMKQQTPALHLSLGEGRRSPGPPWRIHAAFPAGPALALLLSELTNGSEKPRYKMHLYRKGKVKLCDWDLQKRRSVPGGWKHVFVSWFRHFCFFKRKLLKAVW